MTFQTASTTSCSEHQHMPFFHRLKKDINNENFSDIKLQGADDEVVPCSRLAMSMTSTVFADLLDYTDETTFPSPFSGWVLREIRHVCYFGTFSLQRLKFDGDGNDETAMRKLCELLVAMDYYQLDDALSKPIFNAIVSKLDSALSLACVVMDEFDVKSNGEVRKWIRKSVNKAASWLENDPYKVLLPEKVGIGGVGSIQDSNKIQVILSKLKTLSKATVWCEYETLYRWANANKTNQEAAAELWEETDLLQRLVATDSNYFAQRDITAFPAKSFASSQDFEDLYKYASEKNKMYIRIQEPFFVVLANILLFGWMILMLTLDLQYEGKDPSWAVFGYYIIWNVVYFIFACLIFCCCTGIYFHIRGW